MNICNNNNNNSNSCLMKSNSTTKRSISSKDSVESRLIHPIKHSFNSINLKCSINQSKNKQNKDNKFLSHVNKRNDNLNKELIVKQSFIDLNINHHPRPRITAKVNTSLNQKENRGNRGFGQDSRFYEKELLQSKYRPGPGEYFIRETKKNSNRYKSIFLTNKSQSLLLVYDKKKQRLEEELNNNKSRNQNNVNMNSSNYSNNNDNNSNISELNIKKYGPQVQFSKAPRFNSNKENQKDELCGSDENIAFPSTVNRKKSHQTSYFFKSKVLKGQKDEEPVLASSKLSSCNNNDDYQHHNIPLSRNNSMMKVYQSFQQLKQKRILFAKNQSADNHNSNSNKSNFKTYHDACCHTNKFQEKEDEEIIKNHQCGSFSAFCQAEKSNLFIKSKKIVYSNSNKNHFPGPCYYNPMLLPRKQVFHLPQADKWS